MAQVVNVFKGTSTDLGTRQIKRGEQPTTRFLRLRSGQARLGPYSLA